MLAGRLHERFTRMGYRVFYDIESLRSGDFNTKLLEVIEECEDMLLVLPPGGLDRCVNEDDWVRQEVVHALKHQKNIIPVMMRNFTFRKCCRRIWSRCGTKTGLRPIWSFLTL